MPMALKRLTLWAASFKVFKFSSFSLNILISWAWSLCNFLMTSNALVYLENCQKDMQLFNNFWGSWSHSNLTTLDKISQSVTYRSHSTCFCQKGFLQHNYLVAENISSNFFLRTEGSAKGQLASSWCTKMTFSKIALDTPMRAGTSRSISAHL